MYMYQEPTDEWVIDLKEWIAQNPLNIDPKPTIVEDWNTERKMKRIRDFINSSTVPKKKSSELTLGQITRRINKLLKLNQHDGNPHRDEILLLRRQKKKILKTKT